MKIGILSQIKEKKITGINRVTLGTMKELLKLDQVNEYVFLGKTDWLDLPLEYIPMMQNSDVASYELMSYRLNYILMEHPMDIVHSHYRPFELHHKIPCAKILTIHDLAPLVFPQWHGSYFEYFDVAIRKCAGEADTIIADSKNTKQDIIKYYHIPEEKIKVIYLGLYPPKIFNGEVVGKSMPDLENKRFLLSVCGIEARKNLAAMIEAFILYKKQHPKDEIKLVITGPTRQIQVASELLEKNGGHAEDVIFTGYVSDAQLVWLYQQALAFIYVSVYEGFGIPILEAMTLGKAVICSDTSSMPEVGGDAVAYCNPYEIESIADAINRVVEDEKYRCDLEKKGLVQAAKFSYEKAAKETLEIYRMYE